MVDDYNYLGLHIGCKLIKKTTAIYRKDSLAIVSERRVLSKLSTIQDNTSHMFHDILVSSVGQVTWK